jgi:hypothetical protein
VALQHSKPQIIEDVQALHNKRKKDSLWQRMKQNWFECPVDDIRDYFGKFENVPPTPPHPKNSDKIRFYYRAT